MAQGLKGQAPLMAAEPLSLEFVRLLVSSVPIPKYGTGPDSDLVENIRANGILEPIIVRPGKKGAYRLLEGRRRLISAVRCEMEEVPALVATGDVSDDAIKLAVHGLRRSNPVMEVQSIEALLRMGFSESEIAKATGMTVATIRERQGYLRLIPELLEAFYGGKLLASAAKACASLSTGQQQEALAIFKAQGSLKAADIKALKLAGRVTTDPLEGFELPEDSGPPERLPGKVRATITDMVARLERVLLGDGKSNEYELDDIKAGLVKLLEEFE